MHVDMITTKAMSQFPSSTSQVTLWVKNKILTDQKRLRIQKKHIEQDRRWREIQFADVLDVLEQGEAIQIRSSDRTVVWRGTDLRGRTLELLCSMETIDGIDTLIIKEACSFRVGTAYDPKEDDEKLKKEWLKAHPEYEISEDRKRVQKRLSTH